ncbi:MAG: biotin transporter BioY [Candidatus Omnitrophica bacterium]|nr:biotin transporter BioY [Candidatus Omnitrophota bacterium]
MIKQQILTKDLIKDKLILRILGIFVFTICTGLGAFVRIPLPFSPVPITLQTFFVIFSGLVLGPIGAVSQILYILLGVSGLPIFTNSGFGFFYLLGPTGGYLFGFVLTAFLIGRASRKQTDSFQPLLNIILASLLILLCGTAWLAFLLKISFNKAFLLGALPFVPGDIIKSILAYSIYKKIEFRTKEIF